MGYVLPPEMNFGAGGDGMEEVILWESDINIIHPSADAIHRALKGLKIKATVIINSEPPLISRNQLWDRLPVDLRGLRWSLHPGLAFTEAELTRLFRKILVESDPHQMTAVLMNQ
jgi:hypothetical protein